MLAELGQICLILALLISLLQGTVPLLGAHRGNQDLMKIAPRAAVAQFLLVGVAFVLLAHAFLWQDFSVAYVASHSNQALPWYYRISAVWGAHEGSLLLWSLILAGWTLAVTLFSRKLPAAFRTRVLSVLGLVSLGFLAFILFTSNPFDRLLPAPLDGADLNPLLQDPGLIIHPPMLYLGYVGFSVAFAFAVAALLEGRVQADWVRWTRPWTLTAWAFLTAGIALGSWWAYYELGWGGWWFWDPVENASFMPWLAGTALIHSQAVSDKRGSFVHWTLLLAIAAFSLSLLGTFLVRSGVLTSVHAFATDPTRGVFILILLLIVVGGSLLLFALRGPAMTSRGYRLGSRESFLLMNNILLSVMTATVLLGTLYPLATDALGAGKISVGPPYFSAMFAMLMVPLVILMPMGPWSRWGEDHPRRFAMVLLIAAASSIVAGTVTWLIWPETGLRGSAGVAGAVWIVALSLTYLRRLKRVPLSTAGMLLAHTGLAVFLVGATLVESTAQDRHVAMAEGDVVQLAGRAFEFLGVDAGEGPNYQTSTGRVRVRNGSEVLLQPEKRRYLRGQVMTEAAIDAGFFGDIYVSLGEPLTESARPDSWSLRLYHKPFIRWVWLGALMMMLGGLLAAADGRLRKHRRETSSMQTDAQAVPA